MEITIRKAGLSDLDAITEIYNQAILKTTATFDTNVKSRSEQVDWFNKHDDRLPVFVAEENGRVVGWSSLSKWSDRCAYADTGEVSIYIDEAFRGNAIGKKMLAVLVNEGRKQGLHTLISRIAGESLASIRLHEREGFSHVGTLKEVGKKFGKLLDVHLMQKIL